MLLSLVLLPMLMPQQGNSPQPDEPRPVVVSKKHPSDSRGETVYTQLAVDEKADATVPGMLLAPRVVKSANPKFSKALSKEHFTGDVTISGIVAANGEYIDLEVVSGDDVEAIACARKAVEQYRFAPATLGGKPVAVQLQVIVHFEHKEW